MESRHPRRLGSSPADGPAPVRARWRRHCPDKRLYDPHTQKKTYLLPLSANVPTLNPLLTLRLYPFKHDRDALTNPNTHGAQCVASAGTGQLMRSRRYNTCTGHAQRMPQCDGTSVGVDPGIICIDAQLLHASQRLRGKGLVEFDHIHLINGKPQTLEYTLAGRHRPHTHNPRFDTGRSHAQHFHHRRQAISGKRGVSGDYHGRRTIVDA